MRVEPAVFRQLDLRVHAFLSDVPLHDVWRVELGPRAGDPDTRDVRAILSEELFASLGPIVRGLFALRAWLGRAFLWDTEPADRSSQSYEPRLTQEDREASLEPPGKADGPFRVLYVFPAEALGEAINRTVHAFLCLALVPRDAEYDLYWATYVRPGKALTPLYMALIDPFRRWIVYPSVLHRIQRAWNRGPHV